MADVFSKAKRSEVMSKIRSSGTKPEDALYELMRRILGSRRKVERNVKQLLGVPDIHVPPLGLVVFADGCFFHGCPRHGRIPKSNTAYWKPKLEANRKRDQRNRRKLRLSGLAVWSFWEHELKPKALEVTGEKLEKRLVKRILTMKSQRAASG
jgi:DNA mismatch endonuclease (patch repair protein)